MEDQKFNRLLLKTAFSCMTCDGDIDNKEVELIKKLAEEKQIFGDLSTESELNLMTQTIKSQGQIFLRDYLKELDSSVLNSEEELRLMKVAIDVIEADNEVEYSEIKFFKLIRTYLSISNEAVLDKYPEYEDYLEEDIITDGYLVNMHNDFFKDFVVPDFGNLNDLVKD
jgi:uncharacterized tellurite resistance protein B-like protein